VEITFLLDPNANRIAPRTSGSIHPNCDAAALAAVVAAMRFTPATVDGVPVTTQLTIPVRFGTRR
jgi:hypothetical protein